MRRIALAALLAMACGTEADRCVQQNVTVTCCQPAVGDARCFMAGKSPGCGDVVITESKWIGECPTTTAP